MDDIGDYTGQVIMNGNLVIPNDKPDVKRIVRVTAEPSLMRTVAKEKKLIYYGSLIISVKYESEETGIIKTAYFKVPFSSFIPYDPRLSGATLYAKVEAERFTVYDPRVIGQFIVLKVYTSKSNQIRSDLPRFPAHLQEKNSTAGVCPHCKQPNDTQNEI